MTRVNSRRLRLMGPVRTADGGGGFTETWVERGALWGEVLMRSGALPNSDFGQLPRLQVRINTVAMPEGHAMRPKVGDRLLDGSRSYEVEAVHEADRRMMTVLAREMLGAEGQP
ncbi:head-tail adaptor protein [Jannaschia pohangensis]|uniref:Head-tail adaptor n=1 Tax=Jannaschia pohangensis TaxID=390807 RepID=A0A1I3HS42_9RHOB|nr:head-tail adaptor protein [Jannaschia pohangensis]SFI38596.1 head-tail adaptor [Jannaschia pohangensis]